MNNFINIIIKVLSGKLIYIHIDPNITSFYDIISNIQDLEGVNTENYYLLFNGKRLNDKLLICNSDVVNGSTVNLSLKLRD